MGSAMKYRYVTLAACLLLAPAALAQEAYEPPRTPEGRPDFHGAWMSLSLTMVERPREIRVLTPGEEEARQLVAQFWESAPELEDPDLFISNVRTLSVVKGTLRTSHLVSPEDGRFPYTAAGLALAENEPVSSRTDLYEGPEQRPTYERCLAGFGQAPMRTIPIIIPTLIVQTKNALVLNTEDVAGLRIVHIGREAPPGELRSFEGWSSGRWEGDTLVVETTHLRPGDSWRTDFGRPVVVSGDSKVIERFTLVSDDELLYQFTVEDAGLYASPWLAELSFKRHDGPVYEYACHEANYSMTNILLGARVADAKKKTK